MTVTWQELGRGCRTELRQCHEELQRKEREIDEQCLHIQCLYR